MEAERKAAEAKQKADDAQRTKAAAEAAALRAASEKQAREAESERKKAEVASAQEAACKQEQGKLDELVAKGSDGPGVGNLKSFAATVTCARLGPVVVATLEKFNAEAAKRAAALPNSPELIRSAQTQLARLGCFSGKVDGTLTTTKSALGNYMSVKGQPTDNTDVTEALVADLTKQSGRVCPLECKTGEVAKGETCVAAEKPAPATASRRKDDEDSKPSRRKDDEDSKVSRRKDDDEDRQARRKPSSRQADRDPPPRARPAPEAPHARQQAAARPSGGGGRRRRRPHHDRRWLLIAELVISLRLR